MSDEEEPTNMMDRAREQLPHVAIPGSYVVTKSGKREDINFKMSDSAREKAKERGQKSGKGNRTLSRLIEWLKPDDKE